MFKKLTIDELKFLKNLYKIQWPKFVPTFALLVQFIERFEKHPEWNEKVQFLTNNDSSLHDGTFLMNYCNYIVFFNSLEAAPYKNLEALLNTLDFTEEKKFWSIEVYHVDMINELIKLQNLEILFDASTKCTQPFTKDGNRMALQKFGEPPEGFYYDSLRQSDVPRMTSISFYKLPSWYLENVVKYNLTTGLYTSDGELVAWAAMHEVGECGMANVDENYRRQFLGTKVILKQGAKVFDAGKEIFGHVNDKNVATMELFNNAGRAEVIGSHRWFNLIKRKNEMNSHL